MDKGFSLDRNLYPPIPLGLQAYDDDNVEVRLLDDFNAQTRSSTSLMFEPNELPRSATPAEDFEGTLLAASATARTGVDQLPVDHAQMRNLDRDDERRAFAKQGTFGQNNGCAASINPSQLERSSEYIHSQDWTSQIIEEVQDLLQILSPSGKVIFTSPSVVNLLGYEQAQLFNHTMTDFIHPDDKGFFISELNGSLASQKPTTFFARIRMAGDESEMYRIFEIHGHPHFSGDVSMQKCAVPKGFVILSRPYPSPKSALLDSFLEHKFENERLHARIRRLQEGLSFDTSSNKSPSIRPQPSNTTHGSGNFKHPKSISSSSRSESALTKENLARVGLPTKEEGLEEKLSRYDGRIFDALDGVGVRDRKRQSSFGDLTAPLAVGDADVPLPRNYDKNGNNNERKRKKIRRPKMPIKYECSECRTVESPEWRRGPTGPKRYGLSRVITNHSLCNACGLRFSKREKGDKLQPKREFSTSISNEKDSPKQFYPLDTTTDGSMDPSFILYNVIA